MASPPLHLQLLGTPVVAYAGSTTTLPFERRTQLLVWLALHGGWATRAELAALLWPDLEQRLALANTRKALFRLQSAPWAAAVRVDGAALRVEATTDIAQFDAALAQGHTAEALAAWHGEPLAGFDDGQSEPWTRWLAQQRDRLRTAWRSAVLQRAADPDIDAAAAVALTTSLVQSDPYDEAALAAHLDALLQGGQTAAARQAYRDFAERLARELGIEPGAALRARHDAIGSAAAPARTVPQVPVDDGFVGRGIELQRIVDLLARPECRLLSLIGPGGVGKTRLARRVFAKLGTAHADGAVFVEVEGVTTPAQFGPRLADALGLRRAAGGDPLQAAADALKGREQLLVIDNFEDLAPFAAALLEHLLAASPKLKLLVTSRVRLSVASEWSMPLEGLPVPDPEDDDRAEAFDAVRLFVQSARRVEPGFSAAADSAAIVDICRQVEGLPLALELAAAWVRVLPPQAIATELRQGLELLQARDASQPARHASIEVVFDESWRRLALAERDALARLSVFRGGFTAAAAREVAGTALPVLGALTDKSLLRKDPAGERLSLHPLVQQLAAAKLDASGPGEAAPKPSAAQRAVEGEARESTERAHARYYHRLLANLRRAIMDGKREALQQVEIELENCRLAWSWSIAHQASEMLAQSAPSLVSFSEHRGRFEEGAALLTQALDSESATADAKLKALLLAETAQLQFRMDRYTEALAIAARARDAAKLARDPVVHSLCYQILGMCCLRLARYAEARRYLQQGLQRARAADEPRKAVAILHNLALVEKLVGNQDEALRLFLESLARERAVGDFIGEAMCLSNIGLVYAERGDLTPAVAHFREALAISERHGLLNTRMLILAHLTVIAVKQNEPGLAQTYGSSALEIAETTGNRYTVAHIKLSFLRLALRRGDTQLARVCLSESLRVAAGIGRPALLFEAVSCFAEILVAEGEKDCACLLLSFVRDHPLAHAPARDDARLRIAQLFVEPHMQMEWPGLELDELIHRITIETDTAHASLIGYLRQRESAVAR